MIYLASPYSHENPAVREARYRAACRAAAILMKRGLNVFSPIAHSHGLAGHGLPVEWAYWEKIDREYLSFAERMIVLMLEGWWHSVGVQAEIAICHEMGKPVEYVNMAWLLIEEAAK